MFVFPLNIKKKFIQASILVLISLAGISCGGGVTGDAENFVVVKDQSLVQLDEINIEQVSVQRNVWIVVYEAETGLQGRKSDKVIGKKALVAAEYTNVEIKLDREVAVGEVLFVELRADEGTLNVFEPDSTDVVISQSTKTAVSFVANYSNVPFISTDEGILYSNNSIIVQKIISNVESTWVVVHQKDSTATNELGEVVGYSKLANLDSTSPVHQTNFEISLQEEKIAEGDELIVVLYEDNSSSNQFDSSVDTFISINESLISANVTVPVANTSSKPVEYRLLAQNQSAYLWDLQLDDGSYERQSGRDISLEVGKRYTISNPSSVTHPFELLGGDSEVLLSQANIGSFENDPNVNWVENASEFSFTLTQSLANELSGYRCSIHFLMNGDFIV